MKSIWKQTCLLRLPLALVFGVVAMMAQNGNPAYKAKRINRAVELLATRTADLLHRLAYRRARRGGGRRPVSNRARRMRRPAPTTSAMTWSTPPIDIVGLTAYMKGLVAGGPTKSGHRTPAVIVNCAGQWHR